MDAYVSNFPCVAANFLKCNSEYLENYFCSPVDSLVLSSALQGRCCFLPFLFSLYRCCYLYLRCWYIIDQSTENAQVTFELRLYRGEKLTVVRSWLFSISILRYLGCFHWHYLKILPVSIYLRNDLCLKLIILSLMFLFKAFPVHSSLFSISRFHFPWTCWTILFS